MAKLLTETEYNQLQEILNDAARLAVAIAGHEKATIGELLQMVRDLYADRARLEWCVEMGASWCEPKPDKLGWLSYDCDQSGHGLSMEAPTLREAIDRARGAE